MKVSFAVVLHYTHLHIKALCYTSSIATLKCLLNKTATINSIIVATISGGRLAHAQIELIVLLVNIDLFNLSGSIKQTFKKDYPVLYHSILLYFISSKAIVAN